jgi:hypothetical protein
MNLVVVLILVAVVVVAIAAYALRSRRTPVAVAPPQYDDADGVVSEPVPIERIVRGIEPTLLSNAAPPIVAVEAAPSAAVEPPSAAESAPPVEPARDTYAFDTTPTPVVDATHAPAESMAAEPAPPASSTAPEIRWTRRFARNGALDDRTRLGPIRDLGLIRAPWGALLLVQAYDEERDPEYRRAVLTALAAYRQLDARATFEQALRSDDEAERTIAAGALIDLGVVRTLPS